MSRTLLFHDTFLMKGGAERMNIEIAKILGADIATAIWKSDCYDARAMGFRGKIFEVNPDFRKGMLGFLKMKWKFFRSKELLEKYDSVFFSNEAITGIWNVKSRTKTYYYAHSISRHLFDLYDQYLAKVPWYAKIPYVMAIYLLRKLYIAEIQKVDVIFVNSLKNKERMREWFGRGDAIVLYPPVDTEKFLPRGQEEILQVFASEGIPLKYKGYHISFSRLTHAKRVDVIIEAFKQIPEKNVLILYGELDSQKEEFLTLGKGYPNIIFHKLKNNENLSSCISGAITSIAVSREEDFGMVAIESMACGVPVIAVHEGGYQETVIDGKTGNFLRDGVSSFPQEMIDLLNNTKTSSWKEMQDSCIKQAKKFSLENFNKNIQKYLYC